MSQVSLDDVAQTLARSVESGGIDELFEGDPTPDVHSDEGPLPRKDKLNSLAMKTVQLRRPLLTSPSLYIFYFIVEIILRTMVV